MNQFGPYLRKAVEGYSHWCPACEEMHFFWTEARNRKGARWTFDGDVNKPTFAPSMLIRSGHYASDKDNKECWCNYKERFGEEPPFHCRICHYFIREGKIIYCGDCTHALAGQTLPLPELPEEQRDA